MSVSASSAGRSRSGFHLRAYLAGSAATGALIAGVVVLFLSLAAYVSFNGSAIGDSDADSDEVVVNSGAEAPALAAAALRDAAAAVARESAAASPGATARGDRDGNGGATADGTGAATGAGPAQDGVVSNGTPPAAPPVGGAPVSGPAGSPEPATNTSSGPLGETIEQVDNTTGLGLGEATAPVAGPLDETLGNLNDTVQGLGNSVGGAVGGVLPQD